MLVRGRAGLDEFSDEAIGDPKLLDLAARIRYELDPTIEYPRHFEGHVQVKMKDEQSSKKISFIRGGFEDPLPTEEIEAKFRANARLALPEKQVDEIVDLVRRLEQLPAIGMLTEKLIPQ